MNSLVRLFVVQTDLATIENSIFLFLRKARQYRIEPELMISPLQAVTDVYARIMENEYISKAQKQSVLKDIAELIKVENREKFDIGEYTRPYLLDTHAEASADLTASDKLGLGLGGITIVVVAYYFSGTWLALSGIERTILAMMALASFVIIGMLFSVGVDLLVTFLQKEEKPKSALANGKDEMASDGKLEQVS